MSKLEDDLEEALHGVGFNHFRLCDCAPTLSDLIRAFRCAGWAPACERGEEPGWTGPWENHVMMFIPACLLHQCEIIRKARP